MIQTRKKPYQYQEFLNYFIIKSKRNPDVKCHLNLKQYNCLMLMRRRRPHNPSKDSYRGGRPPYTCNKCFIIGEYLTP